MNEGRGHRQNQVYVTNLIYISGCNLYLMVRNIISAKGLGYLVKYVG